MNETKTRNLGEITGDIERHCSQAERSSVPANAEKLLRLTLEALAHLPSIQATANLAHAQAIEAQRVARDVAAAAEGLPAIQATANAAKEQAASAFKVANGAARDAAQAKAPTKTTTKKAA